MAIENKELSTIKKPNTVEYISKEQLIERLKEIKRCREDIIYFAENYYRLQSLDQPLHVVKLYEVQKDLLNFINNNNRAIVCSSRQLGKSTTYCIYVLWLTCFHRDKRVMMLAQKESTALELLDRIKTGYEYLPSWLKPGCKDFNKQSVKFTNGSKIMGFASSAQGVRGQSCNCLVLDEFAFVPANVCSQLFDSVYPVVSSSKTGKVIIVSTPNGKHNLYYDLWQKAGNPNDPSNKDGWKRFTMHWSQIPGRDQKWADAQIAAIGKTRFAQEFDNQFLDDVTTTRLISDEVTEKFREKITEFKIQKINQGKNLFVKSKDGSKTFIFTMYHDFDPSRTYLATADIAEGVGKDSSVLYIWDITDTSNIKMCLKFSDNQTSILDFAYVAYQILPLYANPYIACESNGISLGFVDQLSQTYGYENFVKMGKNGGPGIDSHYTLKTKACIWCRDMLTTLGFGFEIYDEELLDEFPTFIKKDGMQNTIYSAVRGCHDDHIMPLIWGCWILHPDNIQKYYNVIETFQSSTGQLFPKTLAPYEEYTPSELDYISESDIVKDFQYYKKKNNNEFLREHEERVKNDRDKLKAIHTDNDENENNLEEISKKRVLTEDEMIALMRQQTMKEYHSRTQIVGGKNYNPNPQKDDMPSLGQGQNRFWGFGGMELNQRDIQRQKMNVVWETGGRQQGGFNAIFGWDDEEDDGLMW